MRFLAVQGAWGFWTLGLRGSEIFGPVDMILKTLKRPERLLSLGSLDLLSIVPSLLESHEPQTQRLTVFAEDESTEYADF